MSRGVVSVKAGYTPASIKREVEKQVELYLKEVVRIYSSAGQAMVEDARKRTKNLGSYDGGSFGNITWELRSSIACAVYRDGRQVFFYGPVLSTGAGGVSAARDYLNELSIGVDGIQLIVVAGREYARSVESRGYNVISATGEAAEGILETFINQAA